MRKVLWRSVVVALVAVAAVPTVSAVEQDGRRPGRLLVRFSADASAAKMRSVAAQAQGVLKGEIPHTGYYVVEVQDSDGSRPEASSARLLCADTTVADVQYDNRVAPDDVPNDPYFSSQWHLARMGCTNAWAGARGQSVVVAILDTGVDGTHPDLAPKMVPGWNTYDDNANSSDVYGHGTAVAGTAAAVTNNGLGVAGIAWECSIMPVRISDDDGFGYSSTVAAGLTWAADHGARVANISYRFSADSVVRAAAKYFSDRGGVVTISAGNEGLFELSADNPYVLTVSATDSSDQIASWSNRGNIVDVCAPGVGIVTTNNGGGYGSWSGTSFSAPATAGVAALVISACPSLTGPEAQKIIRDTVDDFGAPGWDQTYAYGRVNADRAVALAKEGNVDKTAPTVSFVSPSAGSKLSGSTLLTVSASDDVAVDSVVLNKDGATVATYTAAPYRWTYNTASDSEGSHSFTATAYDAAGNQASATLAVTVENQDKTAPSVAFTSPAPGAKVAKTVTVTLTASDNKAVSSVTLQKDGATVATLTAAPYRWTYSTAGEKNGSHLLVATAVDAAGNRASATLTLNVNNPDKKKPVVKIVSPSKGMTLKGVVQVLVQASDDQALASVEIRKDKTVVALLTSPPYVYLYDSEADKNGSHSFTATAVDTSRNRSKVSVSVKVANPDVKPPTVVLTGPTGTLSAGTVTLTAAATDNVKIAYVRFYMDGVLVGTSKRSPYRLNLSASKVASGVHVFHAEAVDTSGNSAASSSLKATKPAKPARRARPA